LISGKIWIIKTPSLGFFYVLKYLLLMKIIITEEQKKKLFIPITESEESKKGKLFIPRRLSGENSRFIQWTKEQPIVDGERINQFTHNGKKTGLWESYYENGQLWSKGLYENGLREGIWEFYYENGQLWSKVSFKDDKQDGIWEKYWSNGQLSSKGSFKDGNRDGIWEYYDENGQLSSKGSYNNDKYDGIWEYYYKNGQLWFKGLFKDGKKDGIWEYYYENGQLNYRKLYNNGVYNIMETIKASEACDNLNSIKTLEDGKRGIAWVQINDIDDREKKYILKSINKNDFGFITVKENPYKPIIIYRNGYRQNAEELTRIASKYDGYLSGKATYEDSKRIGELLEYDPEDIQTYLNKLYTNKTLNEGQVYSYKLNSSHSDPNKREIIYNFTNKDNYEFEVVFYNLGKNKWEREYRTTKKGLGILNTNDVYNIMETVTNITIDFIEMYEPNKIIITHIHKNKEIDFNNPNKPNKRALLNKRYLKPAIDNLNDYFYSLNRSTSIIEKI
jgi:antitoxin component YwqK of YwqJK toxin-antitoxin module